MFGMIFSLIFVFFAVLSALLGMLKGRKRSWAHGVARIAVVIVSAVLSMLLSSFISYLIGKIAYNGIYSAIPDGSFKQILNDLQSAPDVFRAVVAMMIAPMLFVTFFLIIKAILNKFSGKLADLILKLTTKSADASENTSDTAPTEANIEISDNGESGKEIPASRQKKFDPIGALCGAICGFLIYIVLLIPFNGSLSLIGSTVNVVGSAVPNNAVADTVLDVSRGITDNAGTKTVSALGGNLIYSGLTTYKVNGELVSLANESRFLSTLSEAVYDIGDDSVSNEVAADALREAGKRFEKTSVIPMLLSDFMNSAGESWRNTGEYHGIREPQLGGDLDKITDAVIDSLSGSTYDKVRADVRTLFNAGAKAIEYHDSKFSEGFDILKILSNEKLVAGVMSAILQNERLQPVVGAIADTGLQLLGKQLCIPTSMTDNYDAFICEATDALNIVCDGELEYAAQSIRSVYKKYGIELDGGVAEAIAVSAYINCLKCGKMDDASCRSFLSDRAAEGSATVLTVSTVLNDMVSIYDPLDTPETFRVKAQAKLVSYASTDEGDSGMLAGFLTDSLFDSLGKITVPYTKAVVISPDGFAESTGIVTLDDIDAGREEITDPEAEAHEIAGIISSIADLAVSTGESDYDVCGIVVRFGPMLDSTANSKTFGRETSENLLTGMLQSDSLRSRIGISFASATEIAHSVNASAEENSYTVLMLSLSHTIGIIRNASDGTPSAQQVIDLIQDLTPAAAETLQLLSTADMVQSYGVPEKSADGVSELLSDLFGNISDAKEAGMTEEEYQKEADAVSDMMTLAMTAGKDDSSSGTFGEDGKLGITSDEYVDRIIDSSVMSKTILESVYKDGSDEPVTDPMNTGDRLSDDEKNDLVSSLDARWKEQLTSSDDEEANELYGKQLISIAAMLNVSVTISGDSVTAA